MGKRKYFLSLFLILLLVIIYYSLPAKKAKSNPSENSPSIKTITEPLNKKEDSVLFNNTSKRIDSYNDKEDYVSYATCGVDSEQFYLTYDSLDLTSLKEDELKSFNTMLTNCEVLVNAS